MIKLDIKQICHHQHLLRRAVESHQDQKEIYEELYMINTDPDIRESIRNCVGANSKMVSHIIGVLRNLNENIDALSKRINDAMEGNS